jgi:glycosyltransferase involved in cell wall biosynthesis
MNILMINDYGYNVGGVETYLVDLKKTLQGKGNVVKVLSSSSNIANNRTNFSDYTYSLINQNSPLLIFPYTWNRSALQTLNKILREFKPDIVHLHFIFYHTSPSVLWGLRTIPTIFTVHGHEVLSPMGIDRTSRCKHPEEQYCVHCIGIAKFIPEKIKRSIFGFLSRSVDLYIAPSKHHYKLLSKYGFSPVTHLYNGFQLLYPSPIEKGTNLLYAGRLAKDKGVSYAIMAMPEIVIEIPTASLTIVGTGPEEAKLKELVQNLNLANNVKFIGHIDKDKRACCYEHAQIVVVPSIYPDNLPTVCIEAMGVGRPIIGSDFGGIPELIDNGNTGYIVPPFSSKAIAEKAIELLQNRKLLEAMGNNARKKSEHFSIEEHVDKIEQIYKKVIEKYKLKETS